MSLLLQAAAQADDVYLKSGFVFRNVRTIDTTGAIVHLALNGRTIAVEVELIVRIEKLEITPGQTYVYELYSREMYDAFQPTQEEKEKKQELRRQTRVLSRNTDSTWQITTTSRTRYSHANLLELINDTLVVLQGNQPIGIPIKLISELRLVRDSQFLKGFIIGTGIGALIGLPGLIKSEDYSDLDFIFFTPLGAITGSIIGLMASSDYTCDFTDMEISEKSSELRRILQKESP